MTLTLNYTYRIYPDSKQSAMLSEWLEICRRSYNYALRELKDWIASRKCPIDRCSLESEYIMSADYSFPSYHQQQNQLPKAKKVYPELAKVASQVLQTNFRRLHDAWDFFRNRGFGFPRFKKYGQMKSLLFPQFRSNPLTGWQIQLPKLGKVKVNLHRPIPNGFIIKQVRVIKKAKGWFAVISIQSDITLPEIEAPFGHPLGLDVGLNSYLATSDSYAEKGRKFFKSEHRKLKLLVRPVQRKRCKSRTVGLAIKPNNLISMRVKVPSHKCSGESITPNGRVGIRLLKRGEKEVMINLISNPFEQGLKSNESEGMLILSLSATSGMRFTHWSQKATVTENGV